ncbi:DUF7144 family membrane protein [Prauserella flavalba]|uniref:DUF7144 domain-containing protein n=1 Tax=Prauserella flavalba TaxID=1477506 RepID=A0A318LHL9_9PSEU|nr:hypothetical protein [Prauserella flavalba]PXY24548.1 hypothetical protein BA062_27560 [Prauserella flavalba]
MTEHVHPGTGTATEPRPAERPRETPGGTGTAVRTVWTNWIGFAAVLMIVTGAFNVIAGLVALLNEDYYAVGPQGLLVFDLTAWGWIHLAVGALVLLTGLALFTGKAWAGVVAVVLLGLNAVAQLAFLPVAPLWGVLVIALDVVIIWAIVAHGHEARDLRWW